MATFGHGFDEFDLKGDIVSSLVEARRPALSEEELLILDKIYGQITTDAAAFEDDPLAPTPLDALQLMVGERPFKSFAVDFMTRRLDKRLQELGIELSSMQHESMLSALIAQLVFRIRDNVESLYRFQTAYLMDPSTVNMAAADAVLRVRKAASSATDRVRTIGNYPTMQAIDDVSYTKPLDPDAIDAAMRLAIDRVIGIQDEEPRFRIVQVLSPQEQKAGRRVVELGDLGKFENVATKKPLLYATFGGVALAYKQRESLMLFNPSANLGDNPRRVLSYKGEFKNVQHEGFSNYWSVLGTESDRDLKSVEDAADEIHMLDDEGEYDRRQLQAVEGVDDDFKRSIREKLDRTS